MIPRAIVAYKNLKKYPLDRVSVDFIRNVK